VKQVFGNDFRIKGCWFHFSNAVIKRVKTAGLTLRCFGSVDQKNAVCKTQTELIMPIST
jgi:hypothetical protein